MEEYPNKNEQNSDPNGVENAINEIFEGSGADGALNASENFKIAMEEYELAQEELNRAHQAGEISTANYRQASEDLGFHKQQIEKAYNRILNDTEKHFEPSARPKTLLGRLANRLSRRDRE